MENKKQTAVEWFVEQITDNKFVKASDQIEVINKAKAMEKEQIINFAYYFKHEEFTKKELEQYYNETFKSKQR